MSDNPFAEPEDDNRTVIRPTPGRRRTPAAEQPGVAPSEQPPPETAMRNISPSPTSSAMSFEMRLAARAEMLSSWLRGLVIAFMESS